MTFWPCFEDLARRHGSAIALQERERQITYADLYQAAEQLGASLQAAGIRPGQTVGLYLPKSAEFVAALLGTWAVGAAFVPLDPAWPRQRLDFVIQDAGLAAILAPPGSKTFAPPLASLQALASRQALRLRTALARGPGGIAGDLAYLIYTSGSTGQPKGVLVPHRGLMQVLKAQIAAFALGPGDRSLWFHSQGFDASVSDIGTALLAGATLVIEPDIARFPLADLYAWLRQQRISHWDLPPALLKLLDPTQVPDSLHTMVIGGEACETEVVRRWAQRVRLVNVYGPTEATICSSLGMCGSDWERPLLGQPVPGTEFLVLDETQQPVARGTSGELYIGGLGLALGYQNQPKLTAEKFVWREGQRWYRSGDRVCQETDGQLAFLGRLDRQFKLRGQRIAPEEIEAVLLSHPQIQEAAVLKRPLVPTGPEALVACVSGAQQDLGPWLAARLPAWMVPQRLEWLEALPRNSSGKIDFPALSQRTLLPIPREKPCNPYQAWLKSLWQHVLGVPSPSLQDDFFALGGNSLKALECAALAASQDLPLAPEQLYRHPTLAALAAALEAPAGGIAAETLRQEAGLSAAWKASLAKAAGRPATQTAPPNILLTGATGFLGSRLGMELLARTPARLVCLVRAGNIEHGRSRVLAAMEKHGPLPDRVCDRLTVLTGDLEQPRWGLSPEQWQALGEEIATLFHCAARVNLVETFEQLRSSNLTGTQHLLELACLGRPKALHYASTLSVFVSTDHNQGILRETDALQLTGQVYGGYAQSKWAAEYWLRATAGQSGPLRIYRLGLITGDSRSGYSPQRDWLQLLIQGLAALGCAPAAPELALDITPVDFAAAALAEISLYPEAGTVATYHIANPRSLRLTDLVAAMQSMGLAIATLPIPLWLERAQQRLQSHCDPRSAAGLLALCRCLGQGDFNRYRSLDLFQASGVRFDTRQADRALRGTGLTRPRPEGALLERYIRSALTRPLL